MKNGIARNAWKKRALLLKISQVSDLIGFGRSKTYRLISDGELPHVRIGRSVRVPADELERWIAENTTTGA